MPHDNRSQFSRRDFLVTTGAGVAATLLTSDVAHTQPPGLKLRTRRNVASKAAAADLASLSKGVDALRALATKSPKDPRGWILQAFIHGDCSAFTKCQHGNWFFAPWHRSFIYYFEQLIQHFSGNAGFALPYWDWSRTHGVPASFYGKGNPLDDTLSIRSLCGISAPTAGRGRSVSDSFTPQDLNTYVGPTVISRIQQNPDYATYGGATSGSGELERTPHNFVHRWVGGAKESNMVQTFSPLDPIFWMHHCNIDRLYSNWLSRPGHRPPADGTWRSRSFNDFVDRDGKPVGSAFTCGATVDSRVMGYVYDDAMQLPTTLTAAPPQPGARAEVVETVVASRTEMRDRVLAFVSDAVPSDGTRRVMNAAAIGARDYAARLLLQGVRPPARQDTGVYVFLGPGITVETPTTAPGYVGAFTFFNGHAPEHSHGPSDVLLNATEALKRLYGDTGLPPDTGVVVSLVTRGLYAGIEAFATLEEIRPDKVQLDLVRLGDA